MEWYVSMITLVYFKKSQRVVWALVSGCADFSLPKEGSEVFGLAKQGAFSDIIGLADGLEIKEFA